ncbi:MAG: hypothetical protein HYX45_15160 [Burkholderiales bacterium]|nr:hypothetical protein [Burkholderiales bacterium]
MGSNDADEQDRQEAVIELAELVHLAQETGRRLANKSHGDLYDLAHDVIELLHQVRAQIELIQERSAKP